MPTTLVSKKNKNRDAPDENRPSKILKLMTSLKLDDEHLPPPPPPPPPIKNSSMRRMRMEEEEETDENPPPPPKKKSRKLLMSKCTRMMMMNTETEEEEEEEEEEKMTSFTWESLMPEILESIASRLEPFDYVTFLRVCKSWGQLLKPSQSNHFYPQLVFDDFLNQTSSCSSSSTDDDDDAVKLRNHCIGSSHGWLIKKSSSSHMRYYLFNLYTSVSMHLPVVVHNPTLKNPRIYFSLPPTDPNCTALILDSSINGGLGFLLCNRGGGCNEWTEVGVVIEEERFRKQGDYLSSAVALGGKFYVLSRLGKLFVIDDDDAHLPTTITMLPALCITWFTHSRSRDWFLVESLGELLAVILHRGIFEEEKNQVEEEDIRKRREVTDIQVIQFNFTTMCWMHKGRLLGDQMLFVGLNCSFSVSASEIEGGEGNCVLVADGSKLMKYDMVNQEKMITTSSLPVDLNKQRMFWVRPTF